jgi:predicted DNA-binding transcriptional regulator AlpA
VTTWLTTRDVAHRFGLSPSCIEKWRAHRTGPRFVYLGRSARYSEQDVQAWEAAALATSVHNGA